MRAIIYDEAVTPRFSDLDSNGHVNAAHFLDYVVTSRWAFAAQRFGISGRTFVEHQIAIYLSRSEVHYRRPIVGLIPLRIRSHVVELTDASARAVFEMDSENKPLWRSIGAGGGGR